ncbi:hypothetical protein RM704_20225 [Streptomyces sp. DSM 3412]|uniref:Uncharacterized protein n=1 Tax=Streptomyces gottesmaniae TaxID=3075518 RepID=A0ABU2Z0E4_9ACTN|nr:hypothetical protein [Streptomyces sp. DSM 3412]MDT0569775.1 hypothetical protein [Streptomyces sp. DSM 3412]
MLTSHFSRTEWWIAAAVAGVALATALASLIPARKDWWKAVLPVLAAAVFVGLTVPAEEADGDPVSLMLFTAVALCLALMRVVFAGHIRRQQERARSGRPWERLTTRQTVVFFLAFTAVVALMAGFL